MNYKKIFFHNHGYCIKIMLEIMFDAVTNVGKQRQTLHVCVPRDTQMIQSFDWLK